MNKIKINLDRVGISSEEISKKMNFEDILTHQKIMAKPYYKSAWFFGVTGLATVSLIAGSIYAMEPEGDELYSPNLVMESQPEVNTEIVQLVTQPIEKEKETTAIKKEKSPIDKTNTLITTAINQKPLIIEEELSPVETEIDETVKETKNKSFNYMDLYPRISGRINGGITKEELLNDEGLVTNTDVKIISFQLHLIDGTGGKVYESTGNVLNTEMKNALSQINIGEEIYFEKIDGQSVSGDVVRLSPLRYVLLN